MTTTHMHTFTPAEAAKACGVSRTTIVRAAAAGRITGAVRGDDGAWTIPLDGLLGAGYNPGKPSPPEDEKRDRDDDEVVPRRVHELELALADARAEARAQKIRADELEKAANAYWQLQLEATPSPVAPVVAQESAPSPTPTPTSDGPSTGEQSVWEYVKMRRRRWQARRQG